MLIRCVVHTLESHPTMTKAPLPSTPTMLTPGQRPQIEHVATSKISNQPSSMDIPPCHCNTKLKDNQATTNAADDNIKHLHSQNFFLLKPSEIFSSLYSPPISTQKVDNVVAPLRISLRPRRAPPLPIGLLEEVSHAESSRHPNDSERQRHVSLTIVEFPEPPSTPELSHATICAEGNQGNEDWDTLFTSSTPPLYSLPVPRRNLPIGKSRFNLEPRRKRNLNKQSQCNFSQLHFFNATPTEAFIPLPTLHS